MCITKTTYGTDKKWLFYAERRGYATLLIAFTEASWKICRSILFCPDSRFVFFLNWLWFPFLNFLSIFFVQFFLMRLSVLPPIWFQQQSCSNGESNRNTVSRGRLQLQHGITPLSVLSCFNLHSATDFQVPLQLCFNIFAKRRWLADRFDSRHSVFAVAKVFCQMKTFLCLIRSECFVDFRSLLSTGNTLDNVIYVLLIVSDISSLFCREFYWLSLATVPQQDCHKLVNYLLQKLSYELVHSDFVHFGSFGLSLHTTWIF